MPQIIYRLLIVGGAREIPGPGISVGIKVVGPAVGIGIRQATGNAETNGVVHHVLVCCRVPIIGRHDIVKLRRQVGVVEILGDIGQQSVIASNNATVTVEVTARIIRIAAVPEPVCEQDGEVLLAGLDDRCRLAGIARIVIADGLQTPP